MRLQRLALATVSILAWLWWPGGAHASRVWYEYGLASATGGYDAVNNRTLINKWYLVGFGPDDIATEIKAYVQDCIKISVVSGVDAFQAAPSPEISARLAAAFSAFHGSISTCLSARSAARAYLRKFEIGYVRRGYWENGLHLKFVAKSPSAENYAKLHNAVKNHLPDPVNKVIVFYINTQKPPSIDLKLHPPKELGKFLKELPKPDDLRRFVSRADAEARRTGERILREVNQEAEKATKRLGTEAARAGEGIAVAAVEVASSAAKEVKKIAPDIADAANPLPKVEDDSVTVPTGPGTSATIKTGRRPEVQVDTPLGKIKAKSPIKF